MTAGKYMASRASLACDRRSAVAAASKAHLREKRVQGDPRGPGGPPHNELSSLLVGR